jgi:hypothetical protein
VLIAPVGIKVGPVDRLDIPDIFAMPQQDQRLLYVELRNGSSTRPSFPTRSFSPSPAIGRPWR